MEEIVPLQKI